MEQIRVFLGNIQKKHGSVNSGLLFLLVLRGRYGYEARKDSRPYRKGI